MDTTKAQAYTDFRGKRSSLCARQVGPARSDVPLTDYSSGMLLVQNIPVGADWAQSIRVWAKSGLYRYSTRQYRSRSLEAASKLNCGYVTRWFDRALNFPVQASDGWLTVLAFFRENPLQLICRALEIEDLSADMNLPTAREQMMKRDAVVDCLVPAFRRFTVDKAVSRLQGEGVLSAPILEFAKALRLSQLSHNRMIRPVPVEGQPVRLSRTPYSIRKGPPQAWAHAGGAERGAAGRGTNPSRFGRVTA